jgi:RNA methyltransferase, TrmH family
LSRAEERTVQALKRRRSRAPEPLFMAEGVRVVEELLAAEIDLRFAVLSSRIGDTERGQRLALELARRGRARSASPGRFGALAATDAPQGVIAIAAEPATGLDAIFGRLAATAAGALLVLDGVQDPGNLGTLIRAAEAFGAAGVVALTGTVDPWNPKVVRAAAGSSFRIPVVRAAAAELLPRLRAAGLALVAADVAGRPADGWEPPRRVALVLGNEGAGLSAPVRAAADAVVAIPIDGPTESLNVALAGGILLYLLTRKG